MPTNNRTAFKRLNFFTGFFTTAEDWLQGQQYHLEKRKLHLRGLHTPGIIPGDGEELKVTARRAGSRRAGRTRRGAGPRGQPALPAAIRRSPHPPAGRPAQDRLRLCRSTLRTDTDIQFNVEYPEYSGPTRVSENPGDHLVARRSRTTSVASSSPASPCNRALPPIIDSGRAACPPEPTRSTRAVRTGRADAADPRLRERSAIERLQRLHEYHLAKQRRHNRGLYEPGLLPDVLDELAVIPAGGLDVEVRPGAALDGAGNELYLDQAVRLSIPPPTTSRRVYIVAGYEDRFGAYLGPRSTCRSGCAVLAAAAQPLPHAQGQPGRCSAGPHRLDRAGAYRPGCRTRPKSASPPIPDGRSATRSTGVRVRWALSKAVVEHRLPSELRDRIIELMRLKRGAFAALDSAVSRPVGHRRAAGRRQPRNAGPERVPPPEAADRGPGACSPRWSRTWARRSARLTRLSSTKPEFKRYQDAVAALGAALYARENEQVLLNRQGDVVTAARDLAEVVFEAPEADAGPDQTIPTLTGQADVTLDASRSQAHADQKIVRYHWDKEE